jgi:hypothetical protein
VAEAGLTPGLFTYRRPLPQPTLLGGALFWQIANVPLFVFEPPIGKGSFELSEDRLLVAKALPGVQAGAATMVWAVASLEANVMR